MTEFMATIPVRIPRTLNKWRAAAILYGDWGTSKAYVLGLTFALAGYSSFWFIFAVCLLTLLVGLNYLLICKFYPNGGGVYASVRHRSKVLSLIGAFLLIADYLVTASLSALAAFYYLGVDPPAVWAIGSIGAIGLFQLLGPKHSGSLAIALAVPTVLLIVSLGIMSLWFLPDAWNHLQPVSNNFMHNWSVFTAIIVALSGIESIANTTNVMQLDPGSNDNNPSVIKTATPAIVHVMIEVCLFTCLLALAMNALPGLEIVGSGGVSAPGYPDVRDAMLRYMGEVFAGSFFGNIVGHIFSIIISIVIALLLLSAVSTAMLALISLLFVLSRDGEIPAYFQTLNGYGVPILPTIFAFAIPMVILMVINDISGLANLYAVGFVGAIAVNLGATSTNFKLGLSFVQRGFMFITFIVMACIEITLLIDKVEARSFVFTIIVLGLLLRALVIEHKERISAQDNGRQILPEPPQHAERGILVVVSGIDKALDFAIEQAALSHLPLYILFVREQRVVTESDEKRLWINDEQACKVFDYVIDKGSAKFVAFLYTVTSNTAHSIAQIAMTKKVKQVILAKRKGLFSLLHFIRGTTAREIAKKIPDEIDLVVLY